MKQILVLCLVVLMMAGCAKEEKTVNRAVFASLLRHDNELAKQENANKDPVLNSTMRDYLASEV